MSIANKVISERTACVDIIKSYTKDDKPFFVFVLMRVCDAESIYADKTNECIEFPKNSMILHSGYGHEISEEDKLLAQKKFENLLKKH